MKIQVKRIYNCKDYCISHIYIDDKYICDGLEDTDRMLDDSMSVDEILKIKVKYHTAIPTGTYNIDMNFKSQKYSKNKYYLNLCDAKLPRLQNVKGYSGILWHIGNTPKDTAGCLLLGYNKIKSQVIDSKKAFEKVYRLLDIAKRIGEPIIVTYSRTY